MGLGVLEPKTSLQHVQGTTLLDVHDQTSADNSPYLKKGTGRNAHVVLIPQPSDDLNDPLNWPLWQRDFLLLLHTSCTLLIIGGYASSRALRLQFLISLPRTNIMKDLVRSYLQSSCPS